MTTSIIKCATQRENRLSIKQGGKKTQNTRGANTVPKRDTNITFTKLEGFLTTGKSTKKDSFPFSTHNSST